MVKLLPGDPLDPWLSDLLDTWSRAKRVARLVLAGNP